VSGRNAPDRTRTAKLMAAEWAELTQTMMPTQPLALFITGTVRSLASPCMPALRCHLPPFNQWIPSVITIARQRASSIEVVCSQALADEFAVCPIRFIVCPPRSECQPSHAPLINVRDYGYSGVWGLTQSDTLFVITSLTFMAASVTGVFHVFT